jgi:hypothetical protein
MLLRQRSRFIDDVRHVDEGNERQSRIAVDHCENLVRGIVGHFVSAIISAIGGGASFAVPGSDTPGDTLRAVIVGRYASRYNGEHCRRSGRIGAQVHRGQVENHYAGAAVADKENFAIGSGSVAVWSGHRIHAVAAGCAALRAWESAEVMIRSKARDQVKCWSRRRSRGHVRPASVSGEVAKHINDRRNNV